MYTIHMVRGMRVPVQNRVKWDMSVLDDGGGLATAIRVPMNPIEAQRTALSIRQRIMDAYLS